VIYYLHIGRAPILLLLILLSHCQSKINNPPANNPNNGSEHSNGNSASGSITLTSVDPASAHPGMLIKINGTGFGTDKNLVFVNFKGVLQVPVWRVSDTQIEVVVPTQAQSGDLTVSIQDKTSAAINFSVLTGQTPVLTRFFLGDKKSAYAGLTLLGRSFIKDTSKIKVYFNDKPIPSEWISNVNTDNKDENRMDIVAPWGFSKSQVKVEMNGLMSNALDFTYTASKAWYLDQRIARLALDQQGGVLLLSDAPGPCCSIFYLNEQQEPTTAQAAAGKIKIVNAKAEEDFLPLGRFVADGSSIYLVKEAIRSDGFVYQLKYNKQNLAQPQTMTQKTVINDNGNLVAIAANSHALFVADSGVGGAPVAIYQINKSGDTLGSVTPLNVNLMLGDELLRPRALFADEQSLYIGCESAKDKKPVLQFDFTQQTTQVFNRGVSTIPMEIYKYQNWLYVGTTTSFYRFSKDPDGSLASTSIENYSIEPYRSFMFSNNNIGFGVVGGGASASSGLYGFSLDIYTQGPQ